MKKTSLHNSAPAVLMVAVLLPNLVACSEVAQVIEPAQVIEQSGNLRSDIFDRIRYLPQDSNRYRIPTQEDLAAWRQVVDATLRNNLTTAAQLLQELTPSYKVVKYTDTSGEEPRLYYLLIEAEVTQDGLNPSQVVTGWGTYFFDATPMRELAIEVPHPLADRFTELEGIEALLQLRCRSLLLFGSHRCASDTVSPCTQGGTFCAGGHRVSDASHGAHQDDHTVTNTFQAVHEEIFQFIPQIVAIQLHGNSNPSCSTVFLSNTGSDFGVIPDGNVSRLKASLDSLSVDTTICDHMPGPNECRFCGTQNLQGRWTNGSIVVPCEKSQPAPEDTERFIHIEQDLEMREQPAKRQLLIQAIAHTTFVQ